jgi:AraC family transcriptional regulator
MRSETRSFYEQCVQRAVEHIAASLDGALELEALARLAALSPFHFHRVFRGLVGETPLELARRLRLERAAWQLGRGERAVTELAFDAGYETHEAFTRSFRSRYGCAPTEFRQRHRAVLAAAVPGSASCERPPQIELPAQCGVHFSPSGAPPSLQPHSRGEAPMSVEIETHPEQRVAAVRHRGPYNQISEAFARLGELAGKHGLFAQLRSQPKMVGLYYDDPESTPAAELTSDAGLVVPEGVALPEGLTEVRIPAGRYAKALHAGPYQQLGDAWARLMGGWLPSSGERMGAGPSYEVYRNTPMDTAPEELRTELYLPLA